MKLIPLTQGQCAIIDDEDYELVSRYSWQFTGGYARTCRRINGKKTDIYMHRLILNLCGTEETDHINRNRLDNRRCNLRSCSGQQNHYNTSRRSHNTSGYLGVTWEKSTERWRAQINCCCRHYRLGRYDDVVEAARAYDRKAIELHGEFATTNFPREDYIDEPG